MRGILFMAHSGVRYLVLLSGVIAIAHLSLALKKPHDATTRKVMSFFTGMIDLQVLLGLLTLGTVPFYPALAGHIVMMFAAVFVAHGTVISHRKREGDKQNNGFLLAGVVVTLLLLVVGIMAIGRPLLGTGG